ncbi:hypothetical protein FNB15_17240 [Ferrovibrio terrae]|uniref:FecR protein domain-containing protein n=1 Tax=Ferrovibrio terrae TaxID=2594003 RepID=A0A516H582_9PROT|nr:DUF6600 domain-containing protein [Ferrovibrio terrae]QDO98906.1 hypothetical protein FNB15_17240 [Ferrovibrio terrae]
MSMHRGFKVAATAARRTLAVCAASALIASTAFTPLAPVFAQTPQASQGDSAKPWPGPPITAQTDANDPPARVGRIARMNGTVSFHTADEDQWGPATLNYPLTNGNALWTEPGARAELQIGSGNRLVMDSSTELNVTTLDDTSFEAGLPQGSAYLNIADVAPGESYALQTPRGRVVITEPGRYLVSAGDDDAPTTVSALDRGSAKLSGRGTDRTVPAGQAATLSGPLDGDEPIKTALAPAQASAFAQSVLQDEKALTQTATILNPNTAQAAVPAQRAAALPANAAPVPMPTQVQGMTGAQDLAAYGAWSSAPDYGAVWYPPVETGWVPYRHGHWAYVQPWGWTWVADEPWGFAPFHYGRWVVVHDRWAWSPGRHHHRHHHHHHSRPVYAPALVAFFGGGSGISVTVTTGNVGWVPLGWHEPYYPPYRVSRHYIRNVNVTHVTNITKVTNVTNINNVTVNRYANRGGATMVSADAMRRSEPVQRAVQRVDHRQIENARIDRRARIEPSAATAGMSSRTAERMGIRDNERGAAQRREAPGPDIRQSDRRSTDLKPVDARQSEARRQPQPRQDQARPDQARQDRRDQQPRTVREPQQPAVERPQNTQREAQDLQRQEQRRQNNQRQQREVQERQVQERQGQERQRQQQEMQRQDQHRQEQQRQAVQRQQDVQRQHADQQQREAQRRQQEVQQQSRQQEVRRQQQDIDDQRRQRREQN